MKNILIADDMKTNRKVLTMQINNIYPQFIIHEVDNGKDALEYCKNHNIDIIFMDINMPEMNGFDATSEIKKLFPKIIIIAHTNHKFLKIEEKYKNSGFDCYLLKPNRELENIKKCLEETLLIT